MPPLALPVAHPIPSHHAPSSLMPCVGPGCGFLSNGSPNVTINLLRPTVQTKNEMAVVCVPGGAAAWCSSLYVLGAH